MKKKAKKKWKNSVKQNHCLNLRHSVLKYIEVPRSNMLSALFGTNYYYYNQQQKCINKNVHYKSQYPCLSTSSS